MARLKMYLLGPPLVEVNDQQNPIQRRKVLALLIYLAVNGQVQRRDSLATLFWPDASQSQARAALTRHLSQVRKIVGRDNLITDRETVTLAESSEIWLDIKQFQQLVTNCQEDKPDCIDHLTEAVNLYRDDFLTGFTLPDCLDFDEWQFFQTEELRQAFSTILDRLIQLHSQRGDHAKALPYGRRQVALDPLHEPAHRTLMRLYAFAGQRAAALRQYQLCVDTLADELGVTPSRETEVLRERIRSGEFKKDGSPLVVSAARKPTAPSLKFTPDPLAPYSDRPLLVARDKEVAQLDGFLQQALDGKGRVVFITGEAGEGKTTLMQEFARQAQQKAPELIVAGGNCDAFVGRGDSYLPFREVLVRLSTGQAPGWRQVTVQTIQALINKAPDLVGLFVPGSTLLRQARILTAAETDWLPQLKDLVDLRESQQGLRDVKQVNLFQQYAGVMQALAQTRPLLLVLDDLHWADDGSLDLLFYLGRQLAEQPILIVGTYRPAVVSLGRHSSGSDQPQRHPLEPVINEFQRTFGANQIDLQQAAGQALVADLVDSEPNRLGPEFRAALYDHTQGHALFTVEVLREMQARGELVQDEAGCWVEGAPMHWTQLPARVEGVISERIGRLAPDSREILNVASVMGEEFTAELIARVLQVEERLVIRQLAGILDRQHHLVRNIGNQRVGRQRLSQFRFEHILFQNYLYQNLSQSERGYLHEDIGLALEHLYAGRTEAVTVQLAYHFREAGVAGKAVIYFILAGEGAMRMSAYSEAAQHFNRALPFLAELPEGPERRQQEFTVQFNLGKVWEAINGIGSQEAGVAYSRSLALARQLGEPRKIMQVLLPLTQSAQFRSEFEMAQTYGEECRLLAQEIQDPELLTLANQALQMIALGLGQRDKIVTYGDQVIAFYRSRFSTLTFDDVYKLVFTLGISAISLALVGYPDRALQRVQEGLALAREREHHFGTASVLGLVGSVHIARGEWQEGVRFGEAQRAFSKTHNFPLNRTFGEMHKGGALAMLGEVDEGIALVRQAIGERAKIGVKIADASYIATLGWACGKAGRVAEGLALVNEALAEIEISNDRQNEPEIHRIKGDLLLLQDLAADEQELARQDAEASFRRSIDVAQYQGAKLWEARALASLCRLLHSQGRDEGCRQQLAELYDWFTEGFETEDLQVVRAVLQEMA